MFVDQIFYFSYILKEVSSLYGNLNVTYLVVSYFKAHQNIRIVHIYKDEECNFRHVLSQKRLMRLSKHFIVWMLNLSYRMNKFGCKELEDWQN